ncbi:MAG: Ankyrin repeats (3 copies) [Candidatus Dependentiae bacterium ADurb.Bin331]|nr:MAG: Ankyrin repeats (3 copies) [Candidatus Dependentiae bacterium ADurb.Bin331]
MYLEVFMKFIIPVIMLVTCGSTLFSMESVERHEINRLKRKREALQEEAKQIKFKTSREEETEATARMFEALEKNKAKDVILEVGFSNAHINALKDNQTPLVMTVRQQNISMTQTVLKLGADVHAQNSFFSPIIEAIKKNNIPLAEILKKNNANMNEQRGLNSPFLAAINNRNPIVVDWLLNNGADQHMINPLLNYSPRRYAESLVNAQPNDEALKDIVNKMRNA